MTVAELLEALRGVPGNADVYFHGDGFLYAVDVVSAEPHWVEPTQLIVVLRED